MSLKRSIIFSLLPFCFLSFIIFLQTSRTSTIHHFSHFSTLSNLSPPPPRIAYFISGTDGDGPRVIRLLQAAYHPRNYYLVHLDHRASDKQRNEVAEMVSAVQVFAAAENVNIIKKANPVHEEGSSLLAMVLHGAAILLRWKEDWDWFINLDASDYPLIPQDDFLHVLSFVPRNFSFIEHNSSSSKEYQRIMEIVVDPRLYLMSKGKMFMSTKRRTLPNAFKFSMGSPHVILNRKLVEFSIVGWDNLPRTLLLYLSNSRFSQKGFFQTLACNSKEFSRTVINANLRYMEQVDPRNLEPSDLKNMLQSGAPFAGKFSANDPVLDLIDSLVLHRRRGTILPGGWCLGSPGSFGNSCLDWVDADILKPGPASKRFEKLLLKLFLNMTFNTDACYH